MASSTEHQVTSTHDQEVDNIELFAVKNDDPVTDGEVKETFTAKDNNKTEAEIKINDKANTILNDKGLFAQIKRDNQNHENYTRELCRRMREKYPRFRTPLDLQPRLTLVFPRFRQRRNRAAGARPRLL